MLRVSVNLLTGLFASGGGSRSGGGPRVYKNYRPSEASRFHARVRVPHMKKMERIEELAEQMDKGNRRKEVMAHNKKLLSRSPVARETRSLQRQQLLDRQSQASHAKHFPSPSDASRRLTGSSHAASSNLRRLR